MRNTFALLLCFAALFARAQTNVPVSTLPGVDSLGQNDFFPVVQGGHYHKAYIWQLPSGAGCICRPSGGNGYVQYNGSGALSADSLYTRNPSTGTTTIAYYDTGQYKTGEQINSIGGVLNGAANQMYQASTGNYALSGVIDASTFGGPKMMAVIGVGNLVTLQHNGLLADTGGVGLISDTVKMIVNPTGISMGWGNYSYTFPKSLGLAGQVLTTNGSGTLSWQNIGAGAPGDTSGTVRYAGSTGSDSLFTRSPSTLKTSIAYYENPGVKIGEQVKGVMGVLDGAANQMYQSSTGNYVVSGVVDATPFGGLPMTSIAGVINPATNTANLFTADTTGVQMQLDSIHFGIGSGGLYYNWASGSYTFPNYRGANNQVLTTDSAGDLSWQNVSSGFPGGSSGLVQYSGETTGDTLFTHNPSTLATTIAYHESGYKIGEQVQNIVGNFNGAANQIYSPATGKYAFSGVLDLNSYGLGMGAVLGFTTNADSLSNVFLADSAQVEMKFGRSKLLLDTTGLSYSWATGKYAFPQSVGSNGQVLTTDSVGNLTWQSTPVPAGVTVQTAHVTISPSQMLNLVSSPVQLLAAPGSGKFIQVMSITGRFNFNTTAYSDTPVVNPGFSFLTGLGAYFDTSDLALYNTYSLLLANHTVYSGFILQSDNSSTARIFAEDNAPLKLTVFDTGAVPTNPYGGDGALDIYITYTIITE